MSANAEFASSRLQKTSFVGRDREVAEITELLGTRRLVTLVGSGGIGKTRTSLQVAANLLDGSGNGVWLIELGPLANGKYIPAAIAQALGLSLPPEGDALAHLVTRIKSWHALLVFDNCEHLIDASATSIAALLRGCPKVSVLASSRQGIGVAGEATYRLPSLAVGDAVTDGLSATEAVAAPAVALFVQRAISTDYHFTLTDENASTVVEICRRLDGIPLAIELAAAQVKMLSPRQLRERLDERFRMLTGGSCCSAARTGPKNASDPNMPNAAPFITRLRIMALVVEFSQIQNQSEICNRQWRQVCRAVAFKNAQAVSTHVLGRSR